MFEEARIEGDFTLSSGKKSTVFYDFDRVPPQLLLQWADQLCDKIKSSGLKFDYVVAPAIGGIILGWLVAGEAGVPLVIVDKDGKTRGNWPDKSKFIVVDDVISTYDTIKRVASIFSDKCVGAAGFIFRGKTLLSNTIVLEHKEIET
jgi:orotate phosphoribosyltransferase